MRQSIVSQIFVMMRDPGGKISNILGRKFGSDPLNR